MYGNYDDLDTPSGSKHAPYRVLLTSAAKPQLAAQGSANVADAVAFDPHGCPRHREAKPPESEQYLRLSHRRGADGFVRNTTCRRANPAERRDSRRARRVGDSFVSHRDEPRP